MDISLLRSLPSGDALRLLSQLADVERKAGAWSVYSQASDFKLTPRRDYDLRCTAASLNLSGWPVSIEQVEALVVGSSSNEDPRTIAAARGYCDLLRLIAARYDEIPFLESQIKYFHSLLFWHDSEAVPHRRIYRTGCGDFDSSEDWGLDRAPAASTVASEMQMLTSWTRERMELGDIHPLLVIALFLYRFITVRPFVDGNGRLARALTVYLLLRAGYDHLRFASIDVAVQARRAECVSALRKAHSDANAGGDATPWVEYFLSIVADTQATAWEEYERAAGILLSGRQERLLTALRERGVAKIGELLTIVPIPRATAKKDLKSLVASGHVTASGIGKGTTYRIGRRG